MCQKCLMHHVDKMLAQIHVCERDFGDSMGKIEYSSRRGTVNRRSRVV